MRTSNRLLVLLASLFALVQTGLPQSSSYRFERLAIEHGLSHNAVSSIVQDKQGFLWFGTQDGLNRFDGLRYTVYRGDVRDSLSLRTSNIRGLLADSRGNIWVSTYDFGLHRFDPITGKFTRYLHRPGDTRSLSSNVIECMYEDASGAMWIGTRTGLNKLDPTTGLCERYLIPGTDSLQTMNNPIVTLYDDTQGSLWIIHGGGIAALNYATATIRHIYREQSSVRWITGDSLGNVWAGTSRRILQFDREREVFIPAQHQQQLYYGTPYMTLMDGAGILWSNTPQGLLRYDPRNNASTLFPWDSVGLDLTHYSLRSVGIDRSGIVWFGTFNGIYKFFPAVKHFNLYRFLATPEGRIDRNNVRAFSEDHAGNIWIGSLDGIFRFDPRTKQLLHYTKRFHGLSAIAGSAFWSILAMPSDNALTVLAGVNKLTLLPGRNMNTPRVGRIYPQLDSLKDLQSYVVETLLKDRSDNIWIGFFSAGVSRYSTRTNSVKHFVPDPENPKRLNSGAIFAMCETDDGALWFGTNGGGLNKFDPKTEEFTRYLAEPNNSNSLSDNGVLSLLPDESGILWVGTYSGLNRFDIQQGSFIRFTTDDGLANNVIYGILKDEYGNLWLSSNVGITRFNPTTGLAKNYTLDDGIQDYEFNHSACLKASNGEMYFGGINGFNVFHPDSMKDNSHLPTVVLVDMKILNKSILPGPEETRTLRAPTTTQELFLSYQDAALTFEFAALEFTDPALNQYAYMLEGFDEEWQYVGTKREATYTNLDPGTYTLHAKASNNDGVWNDAALSILIHISPPWWETWWFRGATVLLFLSVGPVIYYRRVTALKRQHALQQEFSRRLIESQELERRRIATELHDSLGQDLLVIKNRALIAEQVKRLNPKAKEQIGHIMKSVTGSLQTVRQIARNLRPYHLDRVGLTGAIRTMLETVAQSSSIAFDIQVDAIDHLFAQNAKEMEINVFRVAQESVNNILKHSEARHAVIRIGTNNHQLNILIKDDGKGFDPSVIHAPDSKAGLGVSGITERVRILGGTYALESAPGAGTAVHIVIPLNSTGPQ